MSAIGLSNRKQFYPGLGRTVEYLFSSLTDYTSEFERFPLGISVDRILECEELEALQHWRKSQESMIDYVLFENTPQSEKKFFHDCPWNAEEISKSMIHSFSQTSHKLLEAKGTQSEDLHEKEENDWLQKCQENAPNYLAYDHIIKSLFELFPNDYFIPNSILQSGSEVLIPFRDLLGEFLTKMDCANEFSTAIIATDLNEFKPSQFFANDWSRFDTILFDRFAVNKYIANANLIEESEEDSICSNASSTCVRDSKNNLASQNPAQAKDYQNNDMLSQLNSDCLSQHSMMNYSEIMQEPLTDQICAEELKKIQLAFQGNRSKDYFFFPNRRTNSHYVNVQVDIVLMTMSTMVPWSVKEQIVCLFLYGISSKKVIKKQNKQNLSQNRPRDLNKQLVTVHNPDTVFDLHYFIACVDQSANAQFASKMQPQDNLQQQSESRKSTNNLEIKTNLSGQMNENTEPSSGILCTTTQPVEKLDMPAKMVEINNINKSNTHPRIALHNKTQFLELDRIKEDAEDDEQALNVISSSSQDNSIVSKKPDAIGNISADKKRSIATAELDNLHAPATKRVRLQNATDILPSKHNENISALDDASKSGVMPSTTSKLKPHRRMTDKELIENLKAQESDIGFVKFKQKLEKEKIVKKKTKIVEFPLSVAQRDVLTVLSECAKPFSFVLCLI
ncbi:hypothetical protein RFI_12846 [Reticulomyxa filosa]|uniref:Uncharacterized protein n=1 Tax=Reticulomyxa filosa TaxID=46433 RepID=X6NG49_RETFI|nr:hypothetical protein RFI_12846 [Reticulomyxa filosa]|eukprot:ETO24312.1 hypothetical protein RFI_12846 [Reticulomyxa filosa]